MKITLPDDPFRVPRGFCPTHTTSYRSGCPDCMNKAKLWKEFDRITADLYHEGNDRCKICQYTRIKYNLTGPVVTAIEAANELSRLGQELQT